MGLIVGSATIANAQFNNDVLHLRAFNDAPASSLTTTNTFPSKVEFNDSNVFVASGGFANRDIWNFSSDGVADSSFGNSNYWDVSFNINLSATGPSALDKEAGFILQNPAGDSQFIVKSTGDVAMFGGVFTYHQFLLPSVANDYQLGTTGTMELKYYKSGAANMLAASFTYGGSTNTFTAATTITAGSFIGGYAQYGVTNTPSIANSGDAVFSGITASVVPEPAPYVVLGLAVLALLRRRA
jgi:hypothetical protein